MLKTLIKLCALIMILGLPGCDRDKSSQFDGYVEADLVYLASPFFGVLDNLQVERGQTVAKDQLLFGLDVNPQRINVQQVQAELEQAKSTLIDMTKPRRPPEIDAIKAQIAQTEARIQLAAIRVSRFEKLLTRQATEKDTLDAAQANLQQEQDAKTLYSANLALALLGEREDQIKAQQEQVTSLIAKLKEAQWNLAQKTVTAPADSVVFDTYYHQGEYVPAQQPVLSLLNSENIFIQFFVPLKFLNTLKVGQKISFSCMGCTAAHEARINYVSPQAEFLPPLVYSRDNDSKLVFRIQARPDNPRHFMPGQPVVVTLK